LSGLWLAASEVCVTEPTELLSC